VGDSYQVRSLPAHHSPQKLGRIIMCPCLAAASMFLHEVMAHGHTAHGLSSSSPKHAGTCQSRSSNAGWGSEPQSTLSCLLAVTALLGRPQIIAETAGPSRGSKIAPALLPSYLLRRSYLFLVRQGSQSPPFSHVLSFGAESTDGGQIEPFALGKLRSLEPHWHKVDQTSHGLG
jgi:hypothetical protein